jgi:hypothetical protein
MADLAIENYYDPNPTALQAKWRHIRAYTDRTYTDEEYKRRLAEIDHQLQQAITITTPAIEEAAELFEGSSVFLKERGEGRTLPYLQCKH